MSIAGYVWLDAQNNDTHIPVFYEMFSDNLPKNCWNKNVFEFEVSLALRN